MTTIWFITKLDFDNMENKDPVRSKIVGYAPSQVEAEDWISKQKSGFYKGWDGNRYPQWKITPLEPVT